VENGGTGTNAMVVGKHRRLILDISTYYVSINEAICLQKSVLTYSAPSGRFIPGKITYSIRPNRSYTDKVNKAIGFYLSYPLQKTEPLYHKYIQLILEVFKV
jgi:hypothetical protein